MMIKCFDIVCSSRRHLWLRAESSADKRSGRQYVKEIIASE